VTTASGSFGNPQGTPVSSTHLSGKAFSSQSVTGTAAPGVPYQVQQRMQLLPPPGALRPKDHTCEDNQCVEEECDPEECGDENRPPRDDNTVCGVDKRPLLPVILVISTVVGALCMMMLQFPLLEEQLPTNHGLRTLFYVLYGITLLTMAYTALCDPGQLSREEHIQGLGLKTSKTDVPEDLPLPKRSHKMWLYALPIRRYDHYCRWLTNGIGLLNHREFIIMMVGLTSIAVLGTLIDLFLIISEIHRGTTWATELLLFMHLGYSIAIGTFVWPLLQLHYGFISRNELANEWKRNDFYIIHSTRSGKQVSVTELSDDEFNDRFDSFQYDQTRNHFDKGMATNCWNFWCMPRWKKGQLGEF